MSSIATATVVVLTPPQLVVGNRTTVKALLLAQLGLGVDVVLDMRRTVSIDSSALGMLVSVARSFALNDHGFIACGLQDGLPLLFNLTQVDQRVTIAVDVDDATSMLAQQGRESLALPSSPLPTPFRLEPSGRSRANGYETVTRYAPLAEGDAARAI